MSATAGTAAAVNLDCIQRGIASATRPDHNMPAAAAVPAAVPAAACCALFVTVQCEHGPYKVRLDEHCTPQGKAR
jgi:hypothetical protein